MKREKVIELAKKSTMDYSQDDNWPFFTEELEEFARLVELETLEMAAKKLEAQHTWITNIAVSALIRNLKETHDKE